MKLKNKINIILNFKIFLILFIFGLISSVFSSERNFIVATIDRSPITYLDLKQKAKLIHFLSAKNNEYKNLNKYYNLSLESLISEKLLIKKALEFNKNILKLTEKDATKYILSKYNNSTKTFRNFLEKNDLSKSVVISNIQMEIIKKYLIGKMFEKEYDDYLKEISNDLENKKDEIDLEQIIIKVNNKNIELINSIDDRFELLSNNGYSFKEITNILSKNNLIKVSGGRSGWQNEKSFKLNIFNKLFQFPEGKILKEKFNNNINFLRIISKRVKGKLSSREQIVHLVKISYLKSKKNEINLKNFYMKNSDLSCKDFSTKLSKRKVYNSSLQKVNLTDFSEKLLLMIKKTNVKQITDPIFFGKENLQFYICSKININKKTNSQKVFNEKKLIQKVDILTKKILKILRKDAIIDIKIKINELS